MRVENKFTRKYMEENELIDEYIDSRELSPGSSKNFITAMMKYCNLHAMSPEELIFEAESDETAHNKVSNRRIKIRLEKFRKYCKEEEYAPRYVKTLFAYVKGFYTEKEIDLPKVSLKKFQIQPKRVEDIPTIDDVRNALKYANTEYKAIILLMFSSGMDSDTIRHLKYSDFYNALAEHIEEVNNPLDIDEVLKKAAGKHITLQWRLVRKKTGYEFYTANTAECTRAILEYIEIEPPSRLDDYLFRVYGRRQIGAGALGQTFRVINDKAGFGRIGRFRKFHAHNVRAAFATTLKKHGIEYKIIDEMLGHRQGAVTEAYTPPSRESIMKSYRKVEPHLVVVEEIEIQTFTDVEQEAVKADVKRIKRNYKDLVEMLNESVPMDEETLKKLVDGLL